MEDTVNGILLLAESDYELPVNIGNPYTKINMLQLVTLILHDELKLSSLSVCSD